MPQNHTIVACLKSTFLHERASFERAVVLATLDQSDVPVVTCSAAAVIIKYHK